MGPCSERAVVPLVERRVEEGPFDLVMVDPAFAYLGGDSNSQKDVSHFMRELLNPLLQRHQVGMLLAHHTNKPLRGKEKDNWEAGDFAYLGAGSAEWINPARAALAIRSLGSDSVFELRAAKRGKLLRWTGAEGRDDPDGGARAGRHHEYGGHQGRGSDGPDARADERAVLFAVTPCASRPATNTFGRCSGRRRTDAGGGRQKRHGMRGAA